MRHDLHGIFKISMFKTCSKLCKIMAVFSMVQPFGHMSGVFCHSVDTSNILATIFFGSGARRYHTILLSHQLRQSTVGSNPPSHTPCTSSQQKMPSKAFGSGCWQEHFGTNWLLNQCFEVCALISYICRLLMFWLLISIVNKLQFWASSCDRFDILVLPC